MSEHREQRIRERAHALWEDDGRPQGRDQEYWFRAERMIEAEDDPNAPSMTATAPV